MATTYDYQTGRIETDFHLVAWDTRCKGSGLPCYAGSDRCQKCQYFGGSLHPFSFSVHFHGRIDESYVRCKHPEAKDSEGSAAAWRLFYEKFKNEALRAFCY